MDMSLWLLRSKNTMSATATVSNLAQAEQDTGSAFALYILLNREDVRLSDIKPCEMSLGW